MKTEAPYDVMELGDAARCFSPIRVCAICDAPSNGYHFNAPSCSACAAFFRRTVTLNRDFVCSSENDCRVNYAMRVICRACRYRKCIHMGMDRTAVQPRRDCNVGRRKISYSKTTPPHVNQPAHQISFMAPNVQPTVIVDKLCIENSQLSPEDQYAASYTSSISEDVPSPRTLPNVGRTLSPEMVLEELLREERLFNERRRLLYCSQSSIANLLSSTHNNDIPFEESDLIELTFAGVQKHIRAQILLVYEWMRGWVHFPQLGVQEKKEFLRRCILYHTILDPAFLTYRLGLKHDRFVMFDGLYVGISEDSGVGWGDEKNCISADLKKKLYRPLMSRVTKEISLPMRDIQLTFVEFVILKALVTFKSAGISVDMTTGVKENMAQFMELVHRALHHHYVSIDLSADEIAERTGNVILLMSSVFAVGMECLESHQKIQFFDLWELDDLLLKLISRRCD